MKKIFAFGVIATASLHSASAVEIKAGDWTVNVGGIVNAYYTAVSCSGDAVGGLALGHPVLLIRSFLLCLLVVCAMPSLAGALTRADLARRFPAPLQVGSKDSDMPVWPIFRHNATATELVGYVFESADLAPIPGFAGVPMNLLIALDPNGKFIDVKVLSKHEPVFLDGLGEAPLLQFASQYRGLSLRQNLHIDSKGKRERAPDVANAWLDGVSKATASVRILNQSVLSASFKVARKKLGFAQGRDPDQIARVNMAYFEKLNAAQLFGRGMVQHVRVLNCEAERLFAGTAGAGLDPDALARPNHLFIDLCVAQVSAGRRNQVRRMLPCLDCVVIYQSDEQCAPPMLEIKRARTIPIASADYH